VLFAGYDFTYCVGIMKEKSNTDTIIIKIILLIYVFKYSSEVSSNGLLDGTPMQQVQHHNSMNLKLCSRHILDKDTVIKLS